MQHQTNADSVRAGGGEDDRSVTTSPSDIETPPNRSDRANSGATGRREYDLSYDQIFEVLYNRRRREVIRYLREHDGTATVSDLAEYIAAGENGITVQQLTSSKRKNVYVGLYQNHLPKMDGLGVIDYNKNRGTVRLRDSVAQFEPYLDDTISNERRVEAVAGIGLAGVVVLGLLDIGAFAIAPDSWLIAVGMVGFLGIALVDAYGRVT